MPCLQVRYCLIVALGVVGLAAGCNTKAPPAAESKAEMNADDEIAAALAKLDNPADREAATQQAICPVSDHALGSMGPPIKVTHGGKSLFLCCEGCKEEFDKDPSTFLAKARK